MAHGISKPEKVGGNPWLAVLILRAVLESVVRSTHFSELGSPAVAATLIFGYFLGSYLASILGVHMNTLICDQDVSWMQKQNPQEGQGIAANLSKCIFPL